MPTYDDDEKSVQAAQPADLYTITTPTTTYHLTSYDTDIVLAGQTYSAATIGRSNVAQVPINTAPNEMIMLIALNHALAQDLLVGGVPQSGVSVRIDCLMLRAGATRRIANGVITHIGCDGLMVKATVKNALDFKVNAVSFPIIVAQRLCQHGLYDAGCTLNPASSQIAPNVVTISADGLTITVTTVAGQPDQWARYGKITRNADGEPRSVMSQIGTSIVVDVPFRTLNLGEAVTINAGCDHTVFTCRDKFANVVNYGGHPLLPEDNIQSPTGIGVLIQT